MTLSNPPTKKWEIKHRSVWFSLPRLKSTFCHATLLLAQRKAKKKLTKRTKEEREWGRREEKEKSNDSPQNFRQKKSITKYSKLEQDAECTFWGDSLKRAHFIGCKKGTYLGSLAIEPGRCFFLRQSTLPDVFQCTKKAFSITSVISAFKARIRTIFCKFFWATDGRLEFASDDKKE